MTKVRCAIIDDEQPARDLLENFAQKIGTLELLGKFKSPLDAMPLITANQLDLIFLDIQMPDMKGTDFLKSLNNGPSVILTTAYPDYALEGYDLNVSDYLLKPFSFQRFVQAVNKASEVILLKKVKDTSVNDSILKINADHKTYRVKFEDILYVEGLKEYVSYFTTQGDRIIALQSLKELEQRLPNDQFLRTHRSYIVRIDQIKYVEGNSVLINEKRIPIGTSYREVVLHRLG